jgi:hypothetical protein
MNERYNRHDERKMQPANIKLEGTGPFYLRAVEYAFACALETTIQLTFYAVNDAQKKELVKIETQMTPHAAEEFADTLLRAAHKAHEAEASSASKD